MCQLFLPKEIETQIFQIAQASQGSCVTQGPWDALCTVGWGAGTDGVAEPWQESCSGRLPSIVVKPSPEPRKRASLWESRLFPHVSSGSLQTFRLAVSWDLRVGAHRAVPALPGELQVLPFQPGPRSRYVWSRARREAVAPNRVQRAFY